MANIKLNIRDGYTIIKIKQEPKHDKIYPLSCSCAKLKLKRSYKSICKFCSAITSSYNKSRVGICHTCEQNMEQKRKIWTTCYLCNQTDFQFEKTNKGFVCQDCLLQIPKEEEQKQFELKPRFCPICEYEIFTNKKGIHLCDYCKAGNIRKSRFLRENKVLCCNCEQATTQRNPNNQNVYCNECKYELFGSALSFERV